jgi:ADP-ribose pyrophosphatase YjhB (NUDIX family)
MTQITGDASKPAEREESRSGRNHTMPFVRIELVVMAIDGDTLKVLRARRSSEPFLGAWALPGGVLRIDKDENLDQACQRTARERLGVELPGAVQLCAVGGPGRDPRAPWTLSVIYRCTVAINSLGAVAGKRIEELAWVGLDKAAADRKMAFDHAALIRSAGEALKAEVDDLRFPPGLLGERFTLTELQVASEVVLGRPLDKSSFRRRIDAAGIVEAVPGEMRTGAFRPAQVFRLVSRAA